MSEDRLEEALQAMRDENPDPEQLADARARVWNRLGSPGTTLCAEIQAQLRDYLEERLSAGRRLLIEDHLSRCTVCRARLAEETGSRQESPIPRRRIRSWTRWGAWAAAAAVLLSALYMARGSIDVLLAPSGSRATVASLTGDLYLVPSGTLKTGAAIADSAVIRTGPGARAVLRLRDGSMVDVNERSELSVHATWSGQSIRLDAGDVIVRAAKQRLGHLRVQTRDSVASVKGTIFAVSTGFNGSVVSVVQGSVAVTQPGGEVLLKPGQQAASNPALAGSVAAAVSWSPDAESYLSVLASLTHIQKQMAALPSPLLRSQSVLLQYMPGNVVVYGAVPNLAGSIEQAMNLAAQQSAENPAFNQWWNSGPGAQLQALIGRLQTVLPLLGDEIVFGLCRPDSASPVPILMAEVGQGKSAELAAALDSLSAGGKPAVSYRLNNDLLAASNSAGNMQWLLEHMGEGAGTAFAQEIAGRYQEGIGWLFGIDMNAMRSTAPTQFVNAPPVKYLFLEQRSSGGVEENEMTIAFNGPRTGIASVLANTGSGGAAEYLPSDCIFGMYLSTPEPQQLFDGLAAQFGRLSNQDFQRSISEVESRMGFSLSNDLARAIGTESAFGLEGLSAGGPVWVMTVLVNDPATLDSAIRKFVDAVNSENERAGNAERLAIVQESVDGKTWTTLRSSTKPLSMAWTYDRGYMVAGSDRAAASRAIATCNGGMSLPWSSAFQQQIPVSAGLHPSGFAWLNTQGAFQGLAALSPDPAIRNLLEERDPILVTLSGTAEQICAASRTRLSGVVINALLLQGAARKN